MMQKGPGPEMMTVQDDIQGRKDRMAAFCTCSGLLVCLFLEPVLTHLFLPFGLSGAMNHLLTKCPVFLVLLLLFYASAKRFVPEEPVSVVLRLNRTQEFSFGRTVLYFLLMVALMLFLSFCMERIENFFHIQLEAQKLVKDAEQASPAHAAAIFLSAVVLAPVAEEILFRGMLYRACRIHLSPFASVLVTAFIFSALHFNLLQFLPLFAMGIVLQTAFIRTHTLRTCILMHASYNLLSLIFIRTLRFFGEII